MYIWPVVAGLRSRNERRGACRSGNRRCVVVALVAVIVTCSALVALAFDGATPTSAATLKQPTQGPPAAPPVLSAYWLVASDGGIFSFGGAPFYGSTGTMTLNEPVVAMAGTPGSKGYWLVASDGGVFSFGDAQFHGSMGAVHLNRPIVDMAAAPTGGGYWLVASDGGIFAFGSARFHGSTGNETLNQPIVSMTPTADGQGYWFTAADGGVFAFGDATYDGSLGGVPQSRPIVAMASDSRGNGYWFTNSNGAVSAFGKATYWGSAPQVLNQPVVGMAEADATGHFSVSTYPSGASGYDVSKYQCGNLPPSPHTIGVVQVNGYPFEAVNPCLATEASWAAGGLNLYTYLAYGSTTSSSDAACSLQASPDACNFGFNAAIYSFDTAQTAGVDTSVAWWLDVETPTGSWSPTLTANASLIQGAIEGLHYAGINNVGIYASPAKWNTIVGDYQPAVPYWMAYWTTTGPASCAAYTNWASSELLPTGPLVLTQFSDHSNGTYDGDYAC